MSRPGQNSPHRRREGLQPREYGRRVGAASAEQRKRRDVDAAEACWRRKVLLASSAQPPTPRRPGSVREWLRQPRAGQRGRRAARRQLAAFVAQQRQQSCHSSRNPPAVASHRIAAATASVGCEEPTREGRCRHVPLAAVYTVQHVETTPAARSRAGQRRAAVGMPAAAKAPGAIYVYAETAADNARRTGNEGSARVRAAFIRLLRSAYGISRTSKRCPEVSRERERTRCAGRWIPAAAALHASSRCR